MEEGKNPTEPSGELGHAHARACRWLPKFTMYQVGIRYKLA